MAKLNEYNLVFKGLKEGRHLFNYSVDSSFFKEINDSVVENGDFKVEVTLLKKSQMLQLDFSIEGKVNSICDNCLAALTVPVSFEGTIYVKFGAIYDEPSEEIIILPHEEHEINLAQLIYEFIVVSLPLRSVHSNETDDDSCDDEMIDRLNQQNHHEEEAISEDDIDPRWEALRKLKNNK
ncbi:YceD family protein [Saccharicrinis aurantiacus]|uniref:YceD family protein n=1 Tax=Saccharicrinis aurantiacus TaxID=1849719 RepID=UPI000837E6E4|nr:DUF177 domain-containing protein [Saccharicrinis aurantiacus]